MSEIDQSNESLLRAWLRASGLFRRTMDPFFAQFDLTGPQWGVLHCLHRAGADGVTEVHMADLGQRLLVRPPSVTEVVQRLRRMGLLNERRSAVDQRAKCIELTAAGRRLVAKILEHRTKQLDRVMGGLSKRDAAQLTRLLEQFSSHMAELVEEEA